MLLVPILVRTLVSIAQYPPSKTGIPYLKLLKEAFIGENLKTFYKVQKANVREKQTISTFGSFFAPIATNNKMDGSREEKSRGTSNQKKYLVIGCGEAVSTDFRMSSRKHMHPKHLHDEYETLDLDKEIKPTHHADIYDEKQVKEKLKQESYDFVVFERFHGDHQKPKKLAEISNYLLKQDGMLAFIAIGRFQFKLLALIANMRANGFKSIILGSGLNCFFFKEGKKEASNIFSSYLNEPYMKKFISGESFFISETNNGTCFDKNNFENLSWDLDEILSEAEELLATEYISHENVLLTILNRRFNHSAIEGLSKKIHLLLKEEKEADKIPKISAAIMSVFTIQNNKKEEEYDLIELRNFMTLEIKRMTESEIHLVITAIKLAFSNKKSMAQKVKNYILYFWK